MCFVYTYRAQLVELADGPVKATLRLVIVLVHGRLGGTNFLSQHPDNVVS
jgi:hypothetical protein